ncbi:MAG TPA: PilZ domain-containing protein [Candidatus Acidoferrum sp.]|nr:PilZ domain-containing protein [Candidatus Acidoferrum sp.]
MTLAAGSGMVYEGSLPLLLEPVAALPPPSQLTLVNESNELLLTNVLMMDDKHEQGGEYDELLQEIKRQDIKLRLVMDLLGMLLMQHNLLPQPSAVRFSGEQLSLPDGRHPEIVDGGFAKCSLYLDASVPKPLVLFAQANGQETVSGEEWRLFAFTGTGQAVQDLLEKFIFRQHRRTVAQQRRH